MLTTHNVIYALKCIRYIFKEKIWRPSGFKYAGKFKKQHSPRIRKSFSLSSQAKALAGKSSAEQVKVR